MYQLKHLSHAVKQALLVGSLSVLSMQVYAQESAPDKNADDASIEKIEVTGSRIKRAELTSPAPVLSVDAAEIARFGNPDLGSILAELPAIGASATLIGNNNINENAGLSSPDLRGLGENRTLTLVNGKRHVAGSPFSSAIDTGSIPNALIQRIDVITGGASAVYGSDAVSGVINIVLRDDFEGVEFRASGNTDTQGIGNDTYNYGVLVGSNFDDERGNITFYAERSQINEVLIPELQQAANWGSYINPDDTGEDDGIPDRLRAQNVGSEFINRFTVINPFGGGPRLTFTPEGTPFTQVSRIFDNSFAFGTFEQPYESVFFGEDYENYIPDQETTTLASTFRYDISNNVRFYGDIKYIEKDIEQQFQPSFRFGGISFNATDNPFLPEAARAELFANGQTGDVEISRFFDDIGNRSAANDRELFRVIGGFDGYFSLGGTDFDYDVFYTYGETSNTRRTLNDLIPGNLNAALDAVIDPATGNIACRSQVAEAQGEGYEDPSTVNPENCAPFNPFGFGQGSAEAYDFISGDVERKDEIEQTVFGGSLSFDSSAYFELPGGPLAFAVGYEYREEKVRTTTDELTKQGVYTNAATPDSSGSFDVDEFFIEISAPLIKDVFLLQELTLDAAFRSADYSHAGNADAWQLGFMWEPIEDVRIRGTVSEAVRAPNVDEAFSPQSPGFANINDPCDADNINDDPDRAANCLALGIPADFEANDNVSIDILSGGNPDLFSETSKSKTVGVVWTPDFINNLSLTLDWYEIDIQDAINAVDAQDILDNCVDATGGPDQSFCNQIDRNDENNVELVRSGFVNASAIYTSGVEFQLRYQAELAALSLPGEIRLNLQGNKVNDLETFEFQDRPDEINVDVGEVGNPEYQLRTVLDYHIGDWVLNHTSRFIDRVATFDVSPGADTPEDLSPAFIGSIWTHDFAVKYFATDNVEMSVGLRNAFNKIPPGYTFDPLYDLVGRRVNASVIVRFE